MEWELRNGFLFLYHGGELYGDITNPSDLYDFSKCSYKDFRKFCIEQSSLSSFDVIKDKRSLGMDWEDYAMYLLDYKTIAEYISMGVGLPSISNATLLYDYTKVTGYCQGDWGYVIYKKGDEVDRKTFEHFIYDSPVYCRAIIDDEEYYILEEYLSDYYAWDRDEIINGINESDMPDYAKEWLTNNLPEYPDYK